MPLADELIDARRYNNGRSIFSGGSLFDVVAALLSTIATLLAFSFAPRVVDFLRIWTTQSLFPLFALALVCAISVALFALRIYRRVEYGVIEVTFAAVSIWSVVPRAPSDTTAWLPIVAAAFLLVQGLENLFEGLKQRVASRSGV